MTKLLWMILVPLFFSTSPVYANDFSESVCQSTDGLLSIRIDARPKQSYEASDGQGGPDPLYYDSWAGVWVDPVSGLLVDEGSEFGDARDISTGARFYIPRGLWVNPQTLMPIREVRLNNFPYYDPKTNESIDPRTGIRAPYSGPLLTLGAIRTAAEYVKYACLGDDLRMRIDPVSGRYIGVIKGMSIDDTLFDSLNAMTERRPDTELFGGRGVPSGFVAFRQYDTKALRDDLGVVNGLSRSHAVALVYEKLAPETAESGTYELREARIEDGIVTQITARGLLDDSVSAVQVLLFFDTSMNGRDRLLNVGVRQKCGRIGSTDAWVRERCE